MLLRLLYGYIIYRIAAWFGGNIKQKMEMREEALRYEARRGL